MERQANMKSNKYTKTQQILAIAGIILLVGLYVTALISSFFKSELATSILYAALFCTFVIPVVIYLFQFFTGKHAGNDKDD